MAILSGTRPFTYNTDKKSPDEARNSTVCDLVRRIAARNGGRIAIRDSNGVLTYSELLSLSSAIARALRAHGVLPGDRVVVLASKSSRTVCAVVGTLMSGACYVPIDPHYPRARIEYVLEDSQASAVIVDTASASACRGRHKDLIDLDEIADDAGYFSDAAHPDGLAYLIYTSGSTGRPKGCMMPHRALLNLIEWQLRATCIEGHQATLSFAPLSFDVCVQEIFSTFAAGGELVIASEDQRRDPFAVLDLIRTHAVARVFLPFVALRELAESATTRDAVLPDLREVITAGEQLQITPQIASFFEANPAAQLVNQYGPTETHVVSEFRLTGSPETWPVLPPIGYPIDGTKLVVVDANGNKAKLGEEGELLIGGVCLAKGYLRLPDVTSERFTPFEGELYYHSGDLCRQAENGAFEYLGRLDSQVKVRGFRVELGEVEQALLSNPAIESCVVTGLRSDHGDVRLCAYLKLRSPAVRACELRAFLADRLPDYMLPVVYRTVETLPMTPSGKIDREGFSAVPWSPLPSGEGPGLPANQLQRDVANIWAEVLGIDTPGVFDNFFDIGGDSLRMVQVHLRLSEFLPTRLAISTLFEFPTISSLSEHLSSVQSPGTTNNGLGARAQNQRVAQERMREAAKRRRK